MYALQSLQVLGYPLVHCRPLQSVDMLSLWSADIFSGRSGTCVLLLRLTSCKTGGTKLLKDVSEAPKF